MSRENFSHPIGTTGDLKDPMGSNGIIRNSKDFEGGPSGGPRGSRGTSRESHGVQDSFEGFSDDS